MTVLGGDCADIDEMNGFYHTLASQLTTLDGGDYSNMSSVTFDNVVRVKQATKFSIDEEGAEATAVTDGELLVTSPGEPQESERFYVTRPFLYILKENSSNTILFIGRITKL
ncbi:MAG: hypothetical protein LUD72_02375 [Bacteroidales bacterium]|nr:hypothetical protein [Bacteroidales bacterium]